MLNHESLIEEGFELNEYPEGKFYEITIEDPTSEILDALEYRYDPEMPPEYVILQTREDFSNTVVSIDGEVWDMTIDDLEKLLDIL